MEWSPTFFIELEENDVFLELSRRHASRKPRAIREERSIAFFVTCIYLSVGRGEEQKKKANGERWNGRRPANGSLPLSDGIIACKKEEIMPHSNKKSTLT